MEDNGRLITESAELADLLAAFFKEKVQNLASGKPDPQKVSRAEANPCVFSLETVDAAIKSLVGKRSFGPDGIPQCVLKDSYRFIRHQLHALLNDFSRNGLPAELKNARVVPLHKKGSKGDKNNYRPISNLSSMSKLFEKCVLSTLESETQGLEGLNQHGFRKSHSTETALLTLQSEVASRLDNKKSCVVYSVDLSAAFDMINPEIFYQNFKDKISGGLMNIICDFLQERSFVVEVEGQRSTQHKLVRGCVQGSILGPRLFTLYCGTLEESIKSLMPGKDIEVVSYADDSYVVVADDVENLKTTTETVISGHVNILKDIDMVVNETKTEIVLFKNRRKPKGKTRAKDPFKSVKISGNRIELSEGFKALGVTFQNDMKWDKHIKNVLKGTKRVLGSMRFLRKYLTEEQFKKVLSTQLFSTMFYCSSVWAANLQDKYISKFNSVFIRMLRVAKGDYHCKIKKHHLVKESGRATPTEWLHYQKISRVIKICRDQQPLRLYNVISGNKLLERRKPGLMFFHRRAKMMIGKQCIQNRLECMRQIRTPWTNGISDDDLRIMLKKTLFANYNFTKKLGGFPLGTSN